MDKELLAPDEVIDEALARAAETCLIAPGVAVKGVFAVIEYVDEGGELRTETVGHSRLQRDAALGMVVTALDYQIGIIE